jgi:hypothetical protein
MPEQSNFSKYVRTGHYLKATDNDDLSPAWVTNYAKAISLATGEDFVRDRQGLHKFTPYVLDRAISAYREMRERENKGLTIH